MLVERYNANNFMVNEKLLSLVGVYDLIFSYNEGLYNTFISTQECYAYLLKSKTHWY